MIRKSRLVLIVLVLFSIACGSKITQANFEKIQTDMTQAEVYKILGEPTETSGVSIGEFSGGTSTWEGDDGVISIQFLNGKVVAKHFVKSKEASSEERG
ncbi:MAG: outer membrane protein assembly factor BamE [Candidatus Abyssobacteria bacterium SURF_5]|jgi:hypothetical protein|uniref:Outer membrane protein assembly factor BamE n=1 Tax=Abyssobacteria bacterium (strain SURF_5) TaxID=2093360 RepID=A0A3A4MVW8_ABYX5|nr:MAG: outer membrane protein assembly factor BamE [Candidatus Abyssubacteria bacterium SURF_5]